MKRRIRITKIMLGVCSAVALLSLLAWLNNISIARQWYADVSKEELYKIVTSQDESTESIKNGLSDTGLSDTEGIKSKVYTGPFPRLNWTFVDVSTISTFIPFFGFLLITIGFFRIWSRTWEKSNKKEMNVDFPFFSSYNPVTIALGLIGTLWGIIMIGYYPQEQVEMSSLILCLHTALYSTLIAVVWVFLVSYPVGYAMRWWYWQVAGEEYKPNEETDTLQRFSELGAAASDASHGLRNTGTETRALRGEVSETKTELEKFGKFLEEMGEKGVNILEEVHRQIDETLSLMNSASKSWETAGEEMRKAVEDMKRERESRKKLEERLAEVKQQKDEAEFRLKTAKKALGGD